MTEITNISNNRYVGEWDMKTYCGIFVESEADIDIVKMILKDLDENEFESYFGNGDFIKVYDPNGINFIPYNHKFEFDVEDFRKKADEYNFSEYLIISSCSKNDMHSIESLLGVEKGAVKFHPYKLQGYKTYRHAGSVLEKRLHDTFIEQHHDHYMDMIVFPPENERQNYASDTLSVREKRICVTMMQWLGTSTGHAFLESCGYELTKKGQDEFYKRSDR